MITYNKSENVNSLTEEYHIYKTQEKETIKYAHLIDNFTMHYCNLQTYYTLL